MKLHDGHTQKLQILNFMDFFSEVCGAKLFIFFLITRNNRTTVSHFKIVLLGKVRLDSDKIRLKIELTVRCNLLTFLMSIPSSTHTQTGTYSFTIPFIIKIPSISKYHFNVVKDSY